MSEMTVNEALLNPVAADERTVRRVLFVCTGNTCRSPMAAALFNHRFSGEGAKWCAASAGLFAAEGAPITAIASDVLAASGVAATPYNNYPAHRARNVTRELIEEADRVIAISASHALELTLRFPEHAAKIESMPMDIADPYGGDEAIYRTCLAEIGYCLALLFPMEEGKTP